MISYNTVVVFSATVLLVALFAFIKYGKAKGFYNPFFYCAWAGASNEITSFILSKKGYHTVLNNQVYMLAEALLLVWQFSRWSVMQDKRPYISFSLIICFWWLAEMAISCKTNNFFSFILFYNASIVLLSVGKLTKLILNSQQKLTTSPVFILCCAFILYFTTSILTEAFWQYGIKASAVYRNTVFTLMAWVNLLCNLFYIYAILWIPTKTPNTSIFW